MCVNLPSCRFGGARTLDPMIKSHVLYQLSYEPIVLRFGHTKVLLFLKLANRGRRKSGAKGARPVRATSDQERTDASRCVRTKTIRLLRRIRRATPYRARVAGVACSAPTKPHHSVVEENQEGDALSGANLSFPDLG